MTVTRNAIWLSACRIAADLTSFVLFAVISRRFGPVGAGEYSYAFALAAFVGILAGSGLDEHGVRAYAQCPAPPQRRQLWTDLIATQAVQLAMAVALLAVFLTLPAEVVAASPGPVLLLSIYLLGWGVARTLFVPAFAAQAMAAPAMAELTCRFAAAVSAIVLAMLASGPLPTVLLGFPIAGLALAVFAFSSARRHGARLDLGGSRPSVLATLRQSWPFAASELLSQFYARADLLLIAHLIDTTHTGYYATGVKFVEVGIVPLVFLGQAAYPLLSRLAHDQPRQFTLAATDLLRAILVLGGLLALGVAFVAPPLVPWLFGDAFAPAAALLPWFCALAVFKAIETALYRLLYAAGRQMVYLRSLMAGTLVNVSANFVLIPSVGVSGAVAAAMAGSVVIGLICAWGLRHVLPPAAVIRLVGNAALALVPALAAGFALGAGASAGPVPAAAAAFGLFALAAPSLGLVPHPRRSPLLAGAPRQA
jgi:PST family polysaccharide transporter